MYLKPRVLDINDDDDDDDDDDEDDDDDDDNDGNDLCCLRSELAEDYFSAVDKAASSE
jgi:hypothetical protein